FAIVFKIRLPPQQRLTQFFQVCGQLGHLHVGFRGIDSEGLSFRGLFDARARLALVLVNTEFGFHLFVAHFLASPMPDISQDLLGVWLKRWATTALAVMPRC